MEVLVNYQNIVYGLVYVIELLTIEINERYYNA